MKTIIVKNNIGFTKTWAGQQLDDQETYQLQSEKEQRLWSADTIVNQDLWSGSLVINNGTVDLSTSEGDAWLKNQNIQDVKLSESASISGVKDPKGMRARLIGIMNETITKNTVQNLDWLCPQLQYNTVNKSSFFDGIQYYASNAAIGDKATFQVVDKDGVGIVFGWYDQATFDAMGNLYVVEEFGTDWYMIPDTMEDLMLYKAQIIPGLYLRMKYTSVGTVNDVSVVVNLFRHMDAT